MPTSVPILSNVQLAPTAAVTGSFLFGYPVSTTGTTSTAAIFWFITDYLENNSATETDIDVAINFPFTVTRYQVIVGNNTKAVATTTAFRDDGADVGAITITGSTTGNFDSGAISTNIASGSLCNWRATGTASGTINFRGFIEANRTT